MRCSHKHCPDEIGSDPVSEPPENRALSRILINREIQRQSESRIKLMTHKTQTFTLKNRAKTPSLQEKTGVL